MIRIDITSAQGNTLTALGIASNVLREAGRGNEVQRLAAEVMTAGSAQEAREIITAATNGVVMFYDPREFEAEDDWE